VLVLEHEISNLHTHRSARDLSGIRTVVLSLDDPNQDTRPRLVLPRRDTCWRSHGRISVLYDRRRGSSRESPSGVKRGPRSDRARGAAVKTAAGFVLLAMLSMLAGIVLSCVQSCERHPPVTPTPVEYDAGPPTGAFARCVANRIANSEIITIATQNQISVLELADRICNDSQIVSSY